MPNKREQEILAIYLNKISKADILTAEEEINLAQKIEAGSRKAREKLASRNLRLVVSIAKKYIKNSLNLTFLGLIQEGNYGLMLAVEGFNWRMNTRFATYASPCIEGTILDALQSKKKILSLDIANAKTEEGESLYNSIEDKKVTCPGCDADKNILREIVKNAVAKLEPIEETIIILAFGLNDGIARSEKEISTFLNLTKNRVRFIKKQALEKLSIHKKLARLKP